MHYTIVIGKYVGELEANVNAKIIEGYEPLGGVAFTGHWAQAMIQRDSQQTAQ